MFCSSTFKSKRRRAIPAAKPLDKQPWFVIARSAYTYSQSMKMLNNHFVYFVYFVV